MTQYKSILTHNKFIKKRRSQTTITNPETLTNHKLHAWKLNTIKTEKHNYESVERTEMGVHVEKVAPRFSVQAECLMLLIMAPEIPTN